MDDALRALRKFYGYESFRPGQTALIQAVLEGRDALGIMPTGAGKSLCYQIPGIVLPGLALVISPLVSLMGDQVRALINAGVRGAYLNSTLTPGQQRTVMRRAEDGTYKIMYVAPERLSDPLFREFAARIDIPFTVGGGISSVDDASRLLDAGADKITLNSAAVANPALIDAIAARYGSQFVVAAIDARTVDGRWVVTTHGGRRPTQRELFAWAAEAADRGAGEILCK